MANVVCFVCGSLGGCYNVHLRKRDSNHSFFPFLEHHDPPYGSAPPGPDSGVSACRLCYSFLNQQWECFERSKTPIIKRLYWLKRADEGQYTGAEMNTQGEYAALLFGLQHHRAPYNPYNESRSNQIPGMMTYKTESLDEEGLHSRKKTREKEGLDLTLNTSHEDSNAGLPEPRKECESHTTMVCYTCGGTESSTNAKFVYSRRQTDAVKFFPFLEKVKPPQGAMPLSRSGLTKVCGRCWDSLQQQWKAYELSNTPEDNRTYRIKDTEEKTEACYVCGQLQIKNGLAQIFAKEKMPGSMYFPFIYSLKRPEWARPIDAEGWVMSCRSCHGVLKHQWQSYEQERVPMANRTYRLLPMSQEKVTPSKKQDATITQPLNIHIATSSPSTVANGSNEGLLAIASHLVKTEESGRNEACFVCGFKTAQTKSHVLSAYPPKSKWEKNRMLPFFPFLANREAKGDGQPMTSTGQCLVCRYCYHSLVAQWYQYERSEKDTNRWFRTYNTHEYVCFVCAQTVKRKHVKAINLKKYPELSAKPVPPGVLIMEEGANSVVCVPCLKRLRSTEGAERSIEAPQRSIEGSHRSIEGARRSTECAEPREQLVLPPKMRKEKYLDDHRNLQPVENGDYNSPKISPVRELKMGAIKQEPPSLSPIIGLPGPPGATSKPPPLMQANNPLTPTKVNRTTATVPPLVSPSNSITSVGSSQAMSATRASSFAAALRKLAKQAKDPNDASMSRESSSSNHHHHHPPPLGTQSAQTLESPNSSNPSPRASTPKRGPPPLVGLGHHSTAGGAGGAVSSPPVGTIAPTQAQSSVSHSHSERRPSYSERPPSHSGRASVNSDSDLRAKDNNKYGHERRDSESDRYRAGTPTKRSTPLTREESRGFQPYRPPTTSTDDVTSLRPPLPPQFPGLDPATAAAAAAAYSYHPAFMAHAFHHPAFRLDDPLMLDRYRMLQPGFLPYAHPGLLHHPGLAHPMMAGARYPAELLQGQIPMVSPSGRILDQKSPLLSAERLKSEDEHRREERERELEKEREREREKERERAKEKERLEKLQREQELLREGRRSPYRDHNGVRYASITHGTPRHSQEALYNPLTASRHKELIMAAHSRHPVTTRPEQLQAAHQKSSTSTTSSRDHYIRDKRELYGRDYDRRLQEEHAKQLQKHHHHQHHQHQHHHLTPHTPQSSQIVVAPPSVVVAPSSVVVPQTKDENKSYDKSSYDKSSSSAIPLISPKHRDYEKQLYRNAVSQQQSSKRPNGLTTTAATAATTTTSQNNFVADYERHFMAEKLFSSSGQKDSSREKENSQPIKIEPKLNSFDLNHLPAHARDFPFQSSRNRELGVADAVEDVAWISPTKTPISRLDKQEERLRQFRLDENCPSDEDLDNDIELENDELLRWQRLGVVKVGRDLPSDRSRRKRDFLTHFGLTTERKKRDLNYVKLCKKRRLYREEVASPTQLTEQASAILDAEERDPASLFRMHRAQTQEEHVRKSDLKRKAKFLEMLGLSVLTSEKRKEKEQLDQICAIYRRRREGSSSDADTPKKELVNGVLPSTPSGHKRKLSEMSDSSAPADRFTFDAKESKSSREFAQEFHESVLKTTREQEASRSAHKKARHDSSSNNHHHPNHVTSPGSRDSRDHAPRDLTVPKISPQPQLPSALKVDNLCQSSRSKSPAAHGSNAHAHAHAHSHHGHGMRWPGIETVIESYNRYHHELALERRVLEQQTLQLKSRNHDLNRSAEQLSLRMADLIQRNQKQQQERLQLQSSVDNLKKSLKPRR